LGHARDVKAIELIERGFDALPPAPAAPAVPVIIDTPTKSPAAPTTSTTPVASANPPAAPAGEPVIKFSVPKK
jgi:hypothetical protein